MTISDPRLSAIAAPSPYGPPFCAVNISRASGLRNKPLSPRHAGQDPAAATPGPCPSSSSGALYLACELGELAAHPFMAFVAVIARMPEEPKRKGDRVERLVNADQPELLLEDPRERGGQRQQRIAVQREEQADQHR